MNNRKRAFIVIDIVLVVLTLAFIWSRSVKSVAESSAESRNVMELIAPFLEIFLGKGNVTVHLVRKLAHFCEYAVLGAEGAVLANLSNSGWRRWIFIASGFVCGAIDENIQFFTGRGNRFSDVMLDFCGFLAGFAVLTVIYFIHCRKKK